MDKKISYFDAITAININNGVVKLVLGNQDLEQVAEGDENQNRIPQATKVVALPINTFIYALAVFVNDPKNQDMITKMQESAGITQAKK